MSSASALDRMEKVVAKIGQLPAIPEVVMQVITVTENPNVSVSEVSRIIEKDPSISAKLLAVANSPYYGMRQVVGTLKLALVVLGVREVRNIVLGVSIVETVTNDEMTRRMQENGVWTDAILAAGIARKLGNYFELSFQGEDFIAGLLHGIGKMVLWTHFYPEYRDICEECGGNKSLLARLEFEHLGFDHADVAAALARSWNLPPTLTDSLYYSVPRDDKRLSEAADSQLAALTRLAALAARESWIAETPLSTSDVAVDLEAWDILGTAATAFSIPERAHLIQGMVQELQAAPALQL